ncbi:MAG: glutamate racemase [Candidatus Kapaibacteriales bacterium]
MDKNKKIGIFDSGVGGLSVLKQFLKYLPNESYVYLGDTARVPYGNKSKETIRQYAKECTNFLLRQDIKMVVVACHTVSAVALDLVEELSNVPVVGMINPAVRSALFLSRNKRIGVIGTRATINSNTYQKTLQSVDDSSQMHIFSKACPLFVPLVEEGFVNHPATKLIAEEYLDEFRKLSLDTLILGCTHYPLLSKIIAEVLPDVELIDPGEQAAIYALRLLAEKNLLADDGEIISNQPKVQFFLTDLSLSFPEITKSFLGYETMSAEIVSIW